MNVTETVQERAGRLGMDIWLSLLPHTELLKRPGHRPSAADRPASEHRLVEVTSTSQLRSGDLILALYNNGLDLSLRNKSTFDTLTVREAVHRNESGVCLVDSVTNDGTAIMFHQVIHIPLGGWASCDPERFGQPVHNIPAERRRIPDDDRRIARLGNLDDFLPALHEHDDYDAWRAAYTAAKAQDTTGYAARKG
jgi:hypothetical protein